MNKLSLFLFFQFFIATTSTIFARPNAIVVGASSGIGKAVAEELAEKSKYNVGIAARRTELLRDIKLGLDIKYLDKSEAPQIYVKTMDVMQAKEMKQNLKELITEMGGTLDLIVISITANTKIEGERLMVDMIGFYNIASAALEIFKSQKHGHLVGISSVDAFRCSTSPTYAAAKAGCKTYLETVRNILMQSQNFPDIIITTIFPGWVNTEKTNFKGMPGIYFDIDAKQAAEQICQAIENKQPLAFVPPDWENVVQLWKDTPDCVYNSWLPWR